MQTYCAWECKHTYGSYTHVCTYVLLYPCTKQDIHMRMYADRIYVVLQKTSVPSALCKEIF